MNDMTSVHLLCLYYPAIYCYVTLIMPILSVLPDKVQKVLVSATITPKCRKLAKDVLKTEFKYITVEKTSVSATTQVKQSKYCL